MRELDLFRVLVEVVPEGGHRRLVVLRVCVCDHRRVPVLVVVDQHAFEERHVVRLGLEYALLLVFVFEADEACVGELQEILGRRILAVGDVETLLFAVRLGVTLIGIARMALSKPPEGDG